MKTRSVSLNIFLQNCQYETRGTNDIKIISKQLPEHEAYTNFPQLIHLDNIETSIEFNLFLIEKFRFNDFSVNHSKRGDEISILRIKSIQTALIIFLTWLTENNINWKDEAYEDNEDPISLFRNYLIDRIKSTEFPIEYETARTYLNDVKILYEWAVHNSLISRLPFTYSNAYYINEHSNITNSKKAPIVKIIKKSINIPKKYKGVKSKTLSAYTHEEYNYLISAKYTQTQNRQIWIKLAKEYGLRRSEIININEDIIDESNNGLYTVTGKFGKKREIYFQKSILNEIIKYCNSDDRRLAVQKYFKKNGYTLSPPLFLNNKGERITFKTITNIIYPVKDELKEQGIIFNKTFHDLRATYALNRVMELWNKGIDMEHIRFVVSDELGHVLFETTKKYLTTKNTRENWIAQSGIGEVLEKNNIYRDEQNRENLNDFL
ncbi:tyrosine-type recombinase/integrase [Acinetobacter sp. FDAARGOS_724]|nr:tyrosine-type recombinase/integrase [Acinetobacter sp. FDAARGOS_724]